MHVHEEGEGGGWRVHEEGEGGEGARRLVYCLQAPVTHVAEVRHAALVASLINVHLMNGRWTGDR